MESRRRRWRQRLGHRASPGLFPTRLGTHGLPLLASAVRSCVLFSWRCQGLMSFPFWLNCALALSGCPLLRVSAETPSSTFLSSHANLPAVAPEAGSWFSSQLLPCPREIRGTYESILYHKAINHILSLCNHTKPPHVSFRVCARIHFCRPHSLAFPQPHRSPPPTPGPGAGGTHVNRCFYCLCPLRFPTVHWLQTAFIYSPSCLACICLQHILHIPLDFHPLTDDDGTK